MKKHKFALFLLVFFSYCKYSPSDIPETYIELPSEANATILFELQPNEDTIKLFEPTTLLYNINTLNKELYGVGFYLDDELLERQNYFNTEPYEFKFNTNNYNEGIYRFSIKVYTNTNTGSLADLVGAAGLMFELEWVLIIDKTEPKKLKFISIDSVENGVKLVWEKFDHASFEYYRLTKSSSAYSGTYDIFFTNAPSLNYFIDTTYIEGEKAYYEIKLNGMWGERVEYFQIPQKPVITYIGGFEVDITWRRVRNPKLLDFYYLYTSPNVSSVLEDEKMYDPEITSKKMNIPFGDEQYFGIRYMPNLSTYVYYHGLLKGETYYELGEEMSTHDYMQRIKSTPYVLMKKNDKVFKYNMETDEFVDSINAVFDISWTYILSEDGNYFGYSSNNEFYLRNTVDLSLVTKLSSPVYDGNPSNLFTYAISNNKRLLAVYKDKSLVLYDLETGLKITQKNIDATNYIFATLSSDGRYIVAKEYDNPPILTYYEVIDNEIIELKREIVETHNYVDLRYAFGANDELYLLYPGKLEIRNKIDFSINKEIVLPEGNLLRTSHEHMITIIKDNSSTFSNKGYLVDIRNGQILYEIQLDGSSYISLYRNYLTSGIGRKLNLNSIK